MAGVVISINKNFIWINNDKNVKLFGFNSIYIASKARQSIRKIQRHHLILEMPILISINWFSFITCFYLYLIVSNCANQAV